ncbi:40101_t:CDS:2 [Gigaspora margarita]|uniref:40101_t:CDS:1 n=2 Tax=Gigaspora margarita TaxID=4874 RepID=A0ABN7V3A5_GIGMA|nr:putative BTB domain protein [Gigaspora margarita]CAG8724957.1 40101_t:CDS:2 [Gigaspora margarita]
MNSTTQRQNTILPENNTIVLFQTLPKGSFCQSYTVNVGGTTFQFSEFSLKRDSPNLFTEYFFGENESRKGTSFTMCIDRDPQIFTIIARYLRGYTIFPLSPTNLPCGMSFELFRQNLMADIHFYKLPALKKQTLPICAFFKSPFNEDWRLDITLSLVKPKDLTVDKEIVLSIHRDGYSIVQFHATDVLWDLVSPQQSYFQFTQQADIFTLRQISKTFRPMYDDNVLFYGCESGPSLYNIDDVDMPGKDVYHNIFDKSRELVKPMVGKCVRVYLSRAIFSLRIPDVPVYGVMTIIPMWGSGNTQLYHLSRNGGLLSFN